MIGARAVVVKDVPPYAIVVGNPARVVRYRFAPDAIEALLGTAWWELDDDEVDVLIPALLADDVARLIAGVDEIRSPGGARNAA